MACSRALKRGESASRLLTQHHACQQSRRIDSNLEEDRWTHRVEQDSRLTVGRDAPHILGWGAWLSASGLGFREGVYGLLFRVKGLGCRV